MKAVVIGGGLAGLAAATFLARGGASVTVLEKAPAPGGRAATQNVDGFALNQGPHALYRGGPGLRVLDELGIRPKGGLPPAAGTALVDDPLRGHILPAGPVSLLSSGLLSLGAKLEAARWLGGLRKLDPASLGGTTVRAWLDATFRHDGVRRLVEALFRVATYANAPDRMSAGVAIAQLQSAVQHNVLYLDGGWQTMVDALRDAARAAGAEIATGARVAAVETAAGAVTAVRLADGSRVAADVVVLTGSPSGAASLLAGAEGAWTAPPEWTRLVPIRAACLDVALSSLPRPRAGFGLGIDRPLYCSVHTRVARLAPEGGAVIHVAKYLAPDADGADAAGELEAVLDFMQPGWRERIVERRFLPNMVVSHALPEAAHGGLAGRPGVAVPWIAGAFVAGDWVGPDGHLADASLASARAAAQNILAAAGLAAPAGQAA